MFPELSGGFLKYLLMGANVIKPVFQVLGYQKNPDAKDGRYRFLISDGETWCNAVLARNLNSMVTNKKLEKFTIVEFTKYVCNQAEDYKMITLLNVTVLVPGNRVNGKLGNPVNSSASDASNRTISNMPAASDDAETSYCEAAGSSSMMFPHLTAGAISRILNEEDEAKSAFTVLVNGLKKVAGTPDCYHLSIFDSVHAWPFVMLGTHLNQMVANKELEKFSVIRVDKYEYKQVASGPKMIILLNITVLNSGNEGNEFCNPLCSCCSDGAATNVKDSELEENKECNCSESTDSEEELKWFVLQHNKELAILKKDEGNEYFKAGNYDLAITYYTRGMQLDPENAVLPANRAMAHLHLLQYQAAENDCTLCLSLDPSYVKAYLRRGTARKALTKYNLARADFLKALELQPDNKQAQLELKSVKMLSSLSHGIVSQILDEEGEAKSAFYVQVFDVTKIPGKPVRYHLFICDGLNGTPFVMLGTHLNHMAANKKLYRSCVIRVDKYEYKQVKSGPKMILLLKICVLNSENSEEFWHPHSSSSSGGATTNAPAVKFAPDSSSKKKKAISPQFSSMMNGPPIKFTQFLFTMFPEVASGAIRRILNGEEVENAVIQILGCNKINGSGKKRYRLLISDGVTCHPFAFLGTQLNHMAANKELEKFTIVRVEKYACSQVETDQKMIVLLNLTVLVPGNEVNEKLGNPVTSCIIDGVTTNAPAVNDVAETDCSNNNPVASLDLSKITLPQLTTGAINRILNGEVVANAVIQILGYKKIPGAGNDRYRFLISDGVTDCPFAMLGTQLNHMVSNKELEKFTIVRVDKCVCHQVQADRKVIILLNLTVLVPGNEVNERLGNPVSLPTDSATTNAQAVTNSFDYIATSAHYSSNITLPQLTTGAINRILNGEVVANAVIQILECKRIPVSESERYILLISDGVIGNPFALLGIEMNHMVSNKELEKYTIVRVDKFVCNQVGDKTMIILLNVTVLVPGNEVNERLGNPVYIKTDSAAAKVQAVTNSFDYNAIAAHDSSKITLPQLTAGAIKRILNGEDVANAVIQILGCKNVGGPGSDQYLLLISDGVTGCPFAMLGPRLNHIVAKNWLLKFTILRVNDYVYAEVEAGQKLIMLLNFTILVPGDVVNEKLGNPVD